MVTLIKTSLWIMDIEVYVYKKRMNYNFKLLTSESVRGISSPTGAPIILFK